MNDRTYLTDLKASNGANWSHLDDDVEQIFMQSVGHGPMGYYDIITVEFHDGSTLNYPAHMVSCWQTAATE